MNELNSEELSQLVSLGGWLRGIEALTELVLQNYSADGARLLHQPALLNYFEKQVIGMSGAIRARPIVGIMQEGLRRTRPLVASRDDRISKKAVEEIAAICAELLKSINTRT